MDYAKSVLALDICFLHEASFGQDSLPARKRVLGQSAGGRHEGQPGAQSPRITLISVLLFHSFMGHCLFQCSKRIRTKPCRRLERAVSLLSSCSIARPPSATWCSRWLTPSRGGRGRIRHQPGEAVGVPHHPLAEHGLPDQALVTRQTSHATAATHQRPNRFKPPTILRSPSPRRANIQPALHAQTLRQ